MGSAANTAMMEREILTKFDSSNHTYKRSCAIGKIVPPMRENIPAIYGEEGGSTWIRYGILTMPSQPGQQGPALAAP
jgi:hypothetical protein